MAINMFQLNFTEIYCLVESLASIFHIEGVKCNAISDWFRFIWFIIIIYINDK